MLYNVKSCCVNRVQKLYGMGAAGLGRLQLRMDMFGLFCQMRVLILLVYKLHFVMHGPGIILNFESGYII